MSEFVLRGQQGLWYVFFPKLEKLGFRHAFTCRYGGDSDIVPGELNLALHNGDNADKVRSNRAQIAQLLQTEAAAFTTCEQVHGTEVLRVDASMKGAGALAYEEALPGVDALFSTEGNLPLFLLFADCVPILLADPASGATAVIHAGWRGSVGGIAGKTVRKMVQELGIKANLLVATIGPSIGPGNYEVDAKVYVAGNRHRACFVPTDKEHWHLDLWRLNTEELIAAGLQPENILRANVCTYENKQLFFSYRAEKGITGRFAAVIIGK